MAKKYDLEFKLNAISLIKDQKLTATSGEVPLVYSPSENRTC